MNPVWSIKPVFESPDFIYHPRNCTDIGQREDDYRDILTGMIRTFANDKEIDIQCRINTLHHISSINDELTVKMEEGTIQ